LIDRFFFPVKMGSICLGEMGGCDAVFWVALSEVRSRGLNELRKKADCLLILTRGIQQGLKPKSLFVVSIGTAKAMPCYKARIGISGSPLGVSMGLWPTLPGLQKRETGGTRRSLVMNASHFTAPLQGARLILALYPGQRYACPPPHRRRPVRGGPVLGYFPAAPPGRFWVRDISS
jgi:hypothetical protein